MSIEFDGKSSFISQLNRPLIAIDPQRSYARGVRWTVTVVGSKFFCISRVGSVVLSHIDRNLLDRCLSRSEGAWEEFVERFLPLLIHVINHTGRLRFGSLPGIWRDDLVAEVLLSLIDDDFAVLRRFRGNSSLSSYLVVIARRVAARKLSKMRRTSGHARQTETAEAADTRDDFRQLLQEDHVETLLKSLPQPEAQAIRLFHIEHRSYAEIGSHLGMPENSVGPLLSRARHLIRTMQSRDKTA